MRIIGYPYAYYTPETQLAVGVGGIMTFYTESAVALRPSKLTLSAYYTTNEQYKISLGTQIFLSANRVVLTANANRGFYVDKFWGIGNDTPETGNESYELKGWGLDADVLVPSLVKWSRGSQVGLQFHFRTDEIPSARDNPYLQDDEILGVEGGVVSGVGIQWSVDTRDSVFYPRSGIYSKLRYLTHGEALGSDYSFYRSELDLRWYGSIGADRVLALQALAINLGGSMPFYELAALGGSRIMRGYYQGRYRDEIYFAVQAEIRSHLWRRFGWVAFAGLGEVGDDPEDLTLPLLRVSYGGGLRLLFDRDKHINLRVDLGIQPEGSGVYFGLEEAF
jgi:outer membrane protein assembly factor BamA